MRQQETCDYVISCKACKSRYGAIVRSMEDKSPDWKCSDCGTIQPYKEVIRGMNKQLFEDWKALKEACGAYHALHHSGMAGGAAMCVCGAGGGGSKACSMLKIIKDLIRYIPSDRLPEESRTVIEELQAII